MSRLNILFLLLFVGLVIWVSLFQPSAIATIQRGAMVVMRPFVKASGDLEERLEGVGEESSTDPSQMRDRLSEVERERDRLKLEVLRLDELIQENNQLRQALQYREQSSLSLAVARVIGRKSSQWYSTVVIDKGSRDGIAVDCPAIIPVGEEAALVGKISQVLGPKSAILLLLTDEMCQVSAKLGDSQEQGIVSGQRGALHTKPDLRLRYLSKEANPAIGTKVESSGAGELFPANLLLGEVTSVTPGVIDAEAIVKPAVDFEHLNDVFIVLPSPDNEDKTDEGEDPQVTPPPTAPAPSSDPPAEPKP